MPHAPLPAKQERSRKSLERLLDAAEEVLKAHGLEGATVPRNHPSASGLNFRLAGTGSGTGL